MERETKDLEYKLDKTNSFLKTVSAFANYCDGRVIFGIRDDGEVVGVSNPVDFCLDLENLVNANIDPVPEFRLSIDEKNNTVTLYVYEGMDKPYCYKNKAYKRSDSSTAAVTRLEYSRLVLEGQNRSYEQLESSRTDLTFHKLEEELKSTIHISRFDEDTLKTMELYGNGHKFNKAAELLSDENDYKILDIVRFGNDIDEITERVIVDHVSILSAYDEAMNVFSRYYKVEKIQGDRRENVELVPEKAFREAVANSIVHRTWDVDQSIQIGMFKDKIEITSPGGLPSEISVEEYKRGRVSVLRNPILAGVFARLGIIEKFGTGIRRINSCYASAARKPEYEVFENSITVILPVLTASYNLDSSEEAIVSALKPSRIMTNREIQNATGFERTKVVRLLNGLVEKKVVEKIGSGRGTKYTLKL